MRLTRRGLFGLLGGAVAAAVCPKPSPEAGAWRGGWWGRTESNWPKRLYFSELHSAEEWPDFTHVEYGLSFEVTEEDGYEMAHPTKRTRHQRWKERKQREAMRASESSDVARRLRAAAERLRQA